MPKTLWQLFDEETNREEPTMNTTLNMTVEVSKTGSRVTTEIYDATDMVDSFHVPDGNGLARLIDHMLHDRGYQRTGSWENLTDDLMTFKVTHYGE